MKFREDIVFIGLRCMLVYDPRNPGHTPGGGWRGASIIHFNPYYIRFVDEKRMCITLDDSTVYRIDEESLQIFLSAAYGEQKLKGDKLEDD